jgi:hypothetical protein
MRVVLTHQANQAKDIPMNRITVSLMQAVALIKEVVESFPSDHRGDSDDTGSCVYIANHKDSDGYNQGVSPLMRLVPVCIVGQVFHNLGILRAMLQVDGTSQFGGCNPNGEDGMAIFANAEAMGVTFSEDAQWFLTNVQSSQDAGNVWPVAFTEGLTETLVRVSDRLAESERLRQQEATRVQEAPLADWERELLAGADTESQF